MTNKASSFPAAAAIPPLRRYGGRIAALGELPIHALGDTYTVDGNGTVLRLPALPHGVPIHCVFTGTPTFVNSAFLKMQGGVNYTFSVGDAAIFLSDGSGVWRCYVLPATAVVQGLTNTRLAKVANYSAANADKGSTIALGGNAFFTLTFNTASGYDANFAVTVVNEDAWSGGRAKVIVLTGGDTFRLWPTQSITVYNQNNVWLTQGRGRARLPSGSFTINTDFTNGSDTLSSADGLATGAGAFKTVNRALYSAYDEFDWRGSDAGQTTLVVLMASGSTDTTQVHLAIQAWPGGQGGAQVMIDGNTSTLSTSSSCIQHYYGLLQIRRLTLTSSAGNLLDLDWGSRMFILDGVVFGASSGPQIAVGDGVKLEFDNNFTISGGGQAFIQNTGGRVQASSISGTISANITYTGFAMFYAANNAFTNAPPTWTLGGHTVTGKKYDVEVNASLINVTNIPGTVAGTTAGGGQVL